MLIRFIISNYLSFGEETEFNMLTGSVRRKKEHVYKNGDIELLKAAAIYGANGAGKSNLIKAILLLRETLKNENGIEGLKFEAFRLNPNMQKKPTQLEIEFISENQTYDYGVAVFEGKIIEEWLYKTKKKEDELIFERILNDKNIQIKVGDTLLKSEEDRIRFKLYEEELLSDKQTLLNMLSKAKKINPDIKNVFNWFDDKLTIIEPTSIPAALPIHYFYLDHFSNFANDLLNTLNTGIQGLELKTVDLHSYFGVDDIERAEEIKNNLKNNKESFEIIHEPNSNHFAFALIENKKIVVKRLITTHTDENNNKFDFEIEEESDGTQRLLDFIPAFFGIILRDNIIVIDEIDQSIHTHLLKELIAKFVNDNESKGQLIFTTHDSNLLDQNIFRQDEIWFTEKKKSGETKFYPLSDFNIRYDLDIEKGYLNGRFGAIPFLGNLEDLNWRQYAS